jgi:septal ring factor EnvC (AmiA/AmiB activator)
MAPSYVTIEEFNRRMADFTGFVNHTTNQVNTAFNDIIERQTRIYDNQFTNMAFLMGRLQERLERIEQENKEIRQELAETRQEVSETRQELAETRQEVSEVKRFLIAIAAHLNISLQER